MTISQAVPATWFVASRVTTPAETKPHFASETFIVVMEGSRYRPVPGQCYMSSIQICSAYIQICAEETPDNFIRKE
jgi:hypothetical protein